MLTPVRFIGEQIDVLFEKTPTFEKSPGCPDGFIWQGETHRILELRNAWRDVSRRGRFEHNMKPTHAARAARRGSWGVGRFYFRVRVADGRFFELYYDRAPKGVDQRKGAWFLRCELADA